MNECFSIGYVYFVAVCTGVTTALVMQGLVILWRKRDG